MSLLPRPFAFRKSQPDVAALEAKVTALQTALNTCKGVAKRWREVHRAVIAGIAAAVLALGFVLGLNAERSRGPRATSPRPSASLASRMPMRPPPPTRPATTPARGGWRGRSPKRAMPAPKRSSGKSTSAAAA